MAESCKKRGVFWSILQWRFYEREEGLLSIHPKTAIFDIFWDFRKKGVSGDPPPVF